MNKRKRLDPPDTSIIIFSCYLSSKIEEKHWRKGEMVNFSPGQLLASPIVWAVTLSPENETVELAAPFLLLADRLYKYIDWVILPLSVSAKRTEKQIRNEWIRLSLRLRWSQSFWGCIRNYVQRIWFEPAKPNPLVSERPTATPQLCKHLPQSQLYKFDRSGRLGHQIQQI